MRLILLIITLISTFSIQSQQTLDKSISHGGLTRTYKLYIPAMYNGSTAVPLVFNLHGYTSDNQEQLLYADFRSIADTANFIIALPQGTLDTQNEAFWNARFGATVDDLGFIAALIDSISLNYNINSDRIYSTGMSNGGFMSFTLACELSDKITAVASVTGSMSTLQPSYCSPNRPVPVMQIHGTADPTVNYNGATGIMSIDDVLSHWTILNNCNSSPTTTTVPNTSTADLCTATRYDYENGDLGSSVVHYKIIDGGHTWPGAPIAIGVTNMDFNASIEIWKFFSQFQMSDFVSVGEILNESHGFKITSENPCNESISYQLNSPINHLVSIVDLSGKKVLQKQSNSNFEILPLQELNSGVYFIRIEFEDKITLTKKIIKQ